MCNRLAYYVEYQLHRPFLFMRAEVGRRVPRRHCSPNIHHLSFHLSLSFFKKCSLMVGYGNLMLLFNLGKKFCWCLESKTFFHLFSIIKGWWWEDFLIKMDLISSEKCVNMYFILYTYIIIVPPNSNIPSVHVLFLSFFPSRCFMFRGYLINAKWGDYIPDWHVIFHVIWFFNTNGDLVKNKWLWKFGKFSKNPLWRSLFYWNCKSVLYNLQLHYNQSSPQIIFRICS